ncbi:MAG TPA: hypothetical protein VL418_09025 [Devosiaceae bacterium]|nr:hypothetical protein [Devosiaceae bacterium]
MAAMHFETDTDNESGQAAFIGRLALALIVLLILSMVAVFAGAMHFRSGTATRPDQAGSSNPAALPSPQPARPTNTNPNATPAPPPSDLPVKGQQAPAAAANQQPAK